jgi:hypothetical protein
VNSLFCVVQLQVKKYITWDTVSAQALCAYFPNLVKVELSTFIWFFVCLVLAVLGFELRAYTSSHSTSPFFKGFF